MSFTIKVTYNFFLEKLQAPSILYSKEKKSHCNCTCGRQEDLDLSGLQESHVDSDEEDLAESIGSFTLRDQVGTGLA